MILNEHGHIAQACWQDLPNVVFDSFVVMPNHVHGVIILREQHYDANIVVGVGLRPAPLKPSLFILRQLRWQAIRTSGFSPASPRLSLPYLRGIKICENLCNLWINVSPSASICEICG